MTHSGESWRLGHRPALDGLRGVAILLVLAGHVSHGRLTNFGSTGVTVFFALSGFLITALLLEEGGRRGRIKLGAFYGRRARRLLPALGVYLAAMIALAMTGAGFFRLTFADVWPVLLYVQNWAMALHGAPTPVAITWSLSVEEQFYLLWPLVLIAGRRWPRLPWLACAVGIAYAVTVRMLVWDIPGAAWKVYYRTDTHMDALLVGCLLALVVQRFGVPAWARWGWPVGAAAVVALLSAQSVWLRVVAEPVAVAAGTAAVIAAVLAGAARWLAWSPLRWAGRRSYALYLWHYPLVVLAWGGALPMWLAVVLAFGFAEVSWWLIEQPAKRWGSRSRSGCGVVRGDAGAAQNGAVVGELVR